MEGSSRRARQQGPGFTNMASVSGAHLLQVPEDTGGRSKAGLRVAQQDAGGARGQQLPSFVKKERELSNNYSGHSHFLRESFYSQERKDSSPEDRAAL